MQSGTVLVRILLLVALDDVRQVAPLHQAQVLPQRLPLLQPVENQRELVRLEQLTCHALALREVPGRREERVNSESEGIFDHVGDDPGEERATEFEAGVVVDLDEPGAEVLVDHEVQPEDLEGELAAAGIKQRVHAADRVGSQSLNLIRGTIILGQTSPQKLQSFSGQLASRYFSKSEKLTLLPFSYLPQSSDFFWTASLVRWTKRFLRFLRVNSLEEVRMQPSQYQQALTMPFSEVTSTQHRMSNFRLLYSSGIRQRCTICDRFFPFGAFSLLRIISLISSMLSATWIPQPWLEFSPGLMIHRFFSRFFFLPSFCRMAASFWPKCSSKRCHSASPSCCTWKVSGMNSKGSCLVARQYRFRLQYSAFLFVMFQLNSKWLCRRNLFAQSAPLKDEGSTGISAWYALLQRSFAYPQLTSFRKPVFVQSFIRSIFSFYLVYLGLSSQNLCLAYSMGLSLVFAQDLSCWMYLLSLFCSQYRLASPSLSEMFHQNLFLSVFLIRILLFPLPTNALQLPTEVWSPLQWFKRETNRQKSRQLMLYLRLPTTCTV